MLSSSILDYFNLVLMQIEIFALVHTLVKYSDKIKLYNDVHISQKKKINISKLFLKYVDDVLVM